MDSKEEKDIKFFNCYNPLRNALRQVPLLDSLYVVWAYYRNICKDFGFKFPNDIETSREVLSPYKNEWDLRLITSEWDLKVLAREILINSSCYWHGKETLRKWKYFAKTFNKIRNISNAISDIYLKDKGTLLDDKIIFQEMHRIVQQQFPWRDKYDNINRYVEIFMSPIISKYIEDIFGISIDKIIFLGFSLHSHFLSQFHHKKFPVNDFFDIPQVDTDKVLSLISRSVEDMKNLLIKGSENIEKHQINEKFFVYKDALTTYPILTFEQSGNTHYICPIPQLIYWRIFNGLYYDCIKSNPGQFGRDFGLEFQSYITRITKKINTTNTLAVYEEVEYLDGNNRKDTIDIQISDNTANVFVECKAKRLTQEAKESLESKDAAEEQIEKILDSVIQGYKSINDYKQGLYPKERINEKPTYLIIVTLEDWNIPAIERFTPINRLLIKKMKEKGLSSDMLEKYPYKVCCAAEYEGLIHIFSYFSISEVLAKQVEASVSSGASVSNFIRESYSKIFKTHKIQESTAFSDVMNKFKLIAEDKGI